jgi:hypothetical protein
MNTNRLLILCTLIFSISIAFCFMDKKPNNTSVDSKDIIERWYLNNDTIFFSKMDLSKNDSVLFEQKYAINLVDSSFMFENKKIYCFKDSTKSAKFSEMVQYFDNHLPSINFDIEITLWIAAIINKDGEVEHVGIIKEPSYYSYIIPTIEVVKKMPKWHPAQIGNEQVSSLVMFPVHHKVK